MTDNSKKTKKKKSNRSSRQDDVEDPPPVRRTVVNEDYHNKPRRNLSLDSIQLCFMGQIFCGFILLLVFLRRGKNSSYRGYGMSVAVVGMVVPFLAMILYSTAYDHYSRAVATSNFTLGLLMTRFLCIWWFVAACILTFGNGPFRTTSNGYFAVWGGVLFSVGAVGDGVSSRSALSATFGMMICSIVLFIAVIGHVGDGDGIVLFALLLSILTMILLLVFFYVNTPLNTNPALALAIFGMYAIAWIVLPFFTTFRGPFVATGNGYFASWIGALCAFITAAGIYNVVG